MLDPLTCLAIAIYFTETYDNLYEAEQDYKDCNIIRIEG